MPKQRHVVLLIADSLRYDAVYPSVNLPFVTSRGQSFHQARSAGCWTLPSTASMFTGLYPHQHGADTASRQLRLSAPPLAARMVEAGLEAHQVTANATTTHIFGLHQGFSSVNRVWREMRQRYPSIHKALVLAGKPRLRRRLFTRDALNGQLAADLTASTVWLQNTVGEVLDRGRSLLEAAEKRGRSTFLFLNLMETHFPYHIADTVEMLSDGAIGALRELRQLYHLVNQSWLTGGGAEPSVEGLAVIRERQRRAWLRLAPMIDRFVEELVTRHDALVVLGSDHGDNFGEHGWAYHFSNVSDAGNRVPLFRVGPETVAEHHHRPFSNLGIFHDLLAAIGAPDGIPLSEAPEHAPAILQSCWYHGHGRTLPRYRHHQLCFIHEQRRLLHRAGRWHQSPVTIDGPEAPFTRLDAGVDPLAELPSGPREAYRKTFDDFQAYTERL